MHTTVARTALAIAVAGAFAGAVPLARADDMSELKAQINALQRKLSELEAKQRAAEEEQKRKLAELEKVQKERVAANAVTAGDIPGSFNLPGSSASIKIGGYVKLDAIYNSRSAGVNSSADQSKVANAIPVGPGAGDNERGQLTPHARQSRFNVQTHTPTDWGPFTTLIEGDFFGAAGNETASNSHGFRLRHAYGTLGKFSAGQYWTTFMNTPALAETLDFGGPVGEIFVRQAQVRWTEKHGSGDWSIALENPESIVGLPGTGTTLRADDDRFPDVVGRVTFNDARGGSYFAALMARNIRVDDPVANDNKWGFGAQFSGRIPLFGSDDFRFVLYGGNGIGRYQPIGFFVDGVVDAGGKLELPTIVGGYGAYRHFWTSNLRSTLALSAARANNPSGTFGTLNRATRGAHLNLIWSPIKPVNLGIEYQYAWRETENGLSGALNRVQFSAQYIF